jgi:hypothetical protein
MCIIISQDFHCNSSFTNDHFCGHMHQKNSKIHYRIWPPHTHTHTHTHTHIHIYISRPTTYIHEFTSPITLTSSQVRSHYIHKSKNIHKSDHNPLTTRIKGLSLAFPTHEDVGTEDSYLSRTLGDGKCLWCAQYDPLWRRKGRQWGPRGRHHCVHSFSHLSHLATIRKQV